MCCAFGFCMPSPSSTPDHQPTPTPRSTEARPERSDSGSPHFPERGVSALAHSERLDTIGRSIQGRIQRISGTRVGSTIKDALSGTWLGHPLHPALTDIPLGAWTTAAACDLITATGKRDLDSAADAALTVGIVGAVGAAATGVADWADVSGAQRRIGLAHAGFNAAGLVLQVGSLLGRRRGMRGAKILSALGFGLALAGAYLGGDLVYRRGTNVERNT